MSPDAELFILSYAQLATALVLTPTHADYLTAKNAVEARLETTYGISQLLILARSIDFYTVAFQIDGEQQIISFAVDEVENFV